MSGAALVLTVVDTSTHESHLVPIEAAALHRRSGRYPTLCGIEVYTASLMTAPARDCPVCVQAQKERRSADLPRGRGPWIRWPRRPRRHGARHG
jgi:hypothetical protein